MQGANDMFVSGAAALGSFSSGPIFATGGFITVAGLGIVVVLIFHYNEIFFCVMVNICIRKIMFRNLRKFYVLFLKMDIIIYLINFGYEFL